MKMTQGYVTDDGTFFERKTEAELYEAEVRLRAALPDGDRERYLVVLLGTITETKRFIDAYEAAHTPARNQPTESEVGGQDERSEEAPPLEGRGYVSPTEEDLAALLKLPVRRHINVPDVGSGSWPEEIPDRGKVDGT
jgi:hypothetical protein